MRRSGVYANLPTYVRSFGTAAYKHVMVIGQTREFIKRYYKHTRLYAQRPQRTRDETINFAKCMCKKKKKNTEIQHEKQFRV